MTQGLTEDFTDQRWYNWRTPALLSSFQSPNRVQLFVTPWTATCQASLSITNSQRLPKLTSVESVMPSNHLNLCRPLLRLPSIFPSTSVFSNESVLHIRWPKYWSFSFSIYLPMNIQYWFPLGLLVWSSCSPRDSGVFSSTIVQKHQFFGTQLSLWSNFHTHTWLLEKPYLWLDAPLLVKYCLCFLICCLGLS